ncbi:MAG TPA: hypothetical protein VMV87_12310, partial [Burkholderiales bacterium]|nr:hypothetical protein [Burkholderiales bacterium]
MQDPSTSGTALDASNAGNAAIFRQAADAGRNALNGSELAALLAGLGIGFEQGAASATTSSAVDVRISL